MDIGCTAENRHLKFVAHWNAEQIIQTLVHQQKGA